MQQKRGILAHIPATIRVAASRTTTWVWLDDDGRPVPGTEYLVRIDVLRVRQREIAGSSICYHVQAFHLGRREEMIAAEPFNRQRAYRRALEFMLSGWAAFEARPGVARKDANVPCQNSQRTYDERGARQNFP